MELEPVPARQGVLSEEEAALREAAMEAALRRAFPDLNALEQLLAEEPDRVIPPAPELRALVGELAENERAAIIAFARQAVDALRRGERVRVAFTGQELAGATALLSLFARPVLRIDGGEFREQPSPFRDELEDRRSWIQSTLASVGRVEVDGHAYGLEWVGTAWVIAEGWVITNRHVVKEFAVPEPGGAAPTRWQLRPRMSVRIAFGEEWKGPLAEPERTYAVPPDAVVHVHPQFDLALVPVSTRALGNEGHPLPAPLKVASSGGSVGRGQKVYTVGYPTRDSNNRELVRMVRLFDDLFDAKRLQPGEIIGFLPERGTLLHDCSTLVGNSGSCVVNLESNRVLGLHYGGFHRHANLAVALWTLANDPVFLEAGVRLHG